MLAFLSSSVLEVDARDRLEMVVALDAAELLRDMLPDMSETNWKW